MDLAAASSETTVGSTTACEHLGRLKRVIDSVTGTETNYNVIWPEYKRKKLNEHEAQPTLTEDVVQPS